MPPVESKYIKIQQKLSYMFAINGCCQQTNDHSDYNTQCEQNDPEMKVVNVFYNARSFIQFFLAARWHRVGIFPGKPCDTD